MNAPFRPEIVTESRMAPTAYQASAGGKPIAMLASLGFTALLVSSLFLLNANGQRQERTSIAVVELDTIPKKEPEKPEDRKVPEEVEMIQPQVSAPVPQPDVPVPVAPLPAMAIARPTPIAVAPPTPPAPPAPPAARAAVASGPADGGDLTGNLVSAKPPSYPVESRRKREQGTVILAVLLSAAGDVAEISIARSSGFERLDKAALQAVKKWRWAPFKRDGVAVTVKGQVAIPFVLST